MTNERAGIIGRIRGYLGDHWRETQHRNAYYLMMNGIVGAVVGLGFWLLVARFAGVPTEDIGVSYAVIALGTTVAVIGKGGLDTALVRNAPRANRRTALHLLHFAIMVGIGACIVVAAAIGLYSDLRGHVETTLSTGWVLVLGIATMLVTTWLQDAFFLAEGDARLSFHRNLVFSAARILLPLPLVWLAAPHPVALAWALALCASAVPAFFWIRHTKHRDGDDVTRKEFLKSSARNISGGAAEFLPGLILAPLVLATAGPLQAAYFGMAWTAASLLFLLAAAISRSALAEMVRNGDHARAMRRALKQQAIIVIPGAFIAAALSYPILLLFGDGYAHGAALTLSILALSTVVVAPTYSYLAILRAQERPIALLVFPIAMVATLLVLAPLLLERYGLAGVAAAWFLANVPVGLYGALRLRQATKEVTPTVPAATLLGTPHVE